MAVKLNQEGTMNREQGINDFQTSTSRQFQEVQLLLAPRPQLGPFRRPSAMGSSGKA